MKSVEIIIFKTFHSFAYLLNKKIDVKTFCENTFQNDCKEIITAALDSNYFSMLYKKQCSCAVKNNIKFTY